MAPKATDKDEIVKILNFMKKVEPLTSGYDISKFNPLLLPNGVVKEWMITAVQSGNQDGLTVWSELVRILGKNLISYYISKAKTDLNKRSLPRPKTNESLYPIGLILARIEILHVGNSFTK